MARKINVESGQVKTDYDKVALEDVLWVMTRQDLRRDLAELFLFNQKKRELTTMLLQREFGFALEVLDYMACIPKTSGEMQDNHFSVKAMRGDVLARMSDPVYDARQRLATLVKMERYEEACLVRDELVALTGSPST